MHRAALALIALASATSAQSACREGNFEAHNDTAVLYGDVVGRGAPVLMIPSLARGPRDFADLSRELASAGFAAVTYEPRWFGRSNGPEAATLTSLADDAAAVLRAACGDAAATVVGHAFGNRVARALASGHPARVSSIVLLAAGGQVPISPNVSATIGIAASQGLRSETERLAALRLAFFKKRGSALKWLEGWSRRAAELQGRALRLTPHDDWQAAGRASLLIVQPTDDPVAPVANADALIAQVGTRARKVLLREASHAILPEQPRAVAAVVVAWSRGERNSPKLQVIIDTRITK